MSTRKRIKSGPSAFPAANGCRIPQLVPPEDLGGVRFNLGSVEFLVLTFAAPKEPRLLPGTQQLTPSERTIVDLALAGFSNSEIAKLRGTSTGTIGNQLSAIYRKLGVGSRRELRAYCLALGARTENVPRPVLPQLGLK